MVTKPVFRLSKCRPNRGMTVCNYTGVKCVQTMTFQFLIMTLCWDRDFCVCFFCTSSFRLAIFCVNCQDVRPTFYRPRELINISSLMGGRVLPPHDPYDEAPPLRGTFQDSGI